MTAKEFIKAIANGDEDIIQKFLDILSQCRAAYCIVGGLAVNAYVEPVVSLDLDVVVVANDIPLICDEARRRGLRVEHFEHSVNLAGEKSDLRIQLQTDRRYQVFVSRAVKKKVLGYDMQVAQIDDVLCGKVWAYQDETRRKSKRQKDLADITRIVEARPDLLPGLPYAVRNLVE